MNSVVNSFQTVTRSIISRAISAMVTESMPVVHKSHHVVDPVLDALVVRFQDAKFLNQNDVTSVTWPREKEGIARRKHVRGELLNAARRIRGAGRIRVA